ncbi:MAG: GTP-binding protein [Actinomycetota bacterium]|nr:GTP-binding protein [Actinomycetota bacterium]
MAAVDATRHDARILEELNDGAGLLRLATAGSVDDGKSTLIGRLLYDSKAILADQLEQVEDASRRRGGAVGDLDLSLLTDGLRAEREQGITIDVANRYFATARREFVIADTPGHVQYTRNMVTGASTADLAVVLVDARHGVIEQSRRHAFVAALLGIPHIVVAVNKMDLVDFDQARFTAIEADFRKLARRLGLDDVTAIPMSALHGDNVVDRSQRTPWYDGPALLEHLEQVEVADDVNRGELRFPVQWVIRDHASDFRGYAGQLAGGVLRAGDEIVVLPSGRRSTVAAVEAFEGALDVAVPGQSVTVRLTDELDVSRGDILCGVDGAPEPRRALEADLCWLAEAPLGDRGRYAIKLMTQTARAVVDEVVHRVDMVSLDEQPADGLQLNDIGRVRLRLSAPLVFDAYAGNRTTGAFILVDEATNDTVAAGMAR